LPVSSAPARQHEKAIQHRRNCIAKDLCH
jgi:hypothetical protein